MSQFLFDHPIVREIRQASGVLGDNLYLVGGAARDYLLSGTWPTDWDFATPLTPDKVLELLDDRYPIWEAGREFGTIGVFIRDQKVDITTFRTETYPNNTRFPVVDFTNDLRLDTSRRDFTINSIVIDPKGKVLDFHGGEKDLRDGVIRAVGVPAERFSEDPHRIMRMYRFALKYGFRVDPLTLSDAAQCAVKILSVSHERWTMEFEKILSLYDGRGISRPLLEHFFTASVGKYILPEVAALGGIRQWGPYHNGDTVLVHVLKTVEELNHNFGQSEPPVLWAALLHDVGKLTTHSIDPEDEVSHFYGHEGVGELIAEGIADRFVLSNEDKDRVKCLVREHMAPTRLIRVKYGQRAIRRLINRTTPWTNDLLKVAYADCASHSGLVPGDLEKITALWTEIDVTPTYEDGKSYELPSHLGTHIMEAFQLPSGPGIGDAIDAVVRAIDEERLSSTPSLDEALEVVQGYLEAQ